MTSTDPAPEGQGIPQGKARRALAARRRMLAYMAATAVAVAGTAAGVIATHSSPHPAPRTHVASPKTPAPKRDVLSAAAFTASWNRLVAGPSLATHGSLVLDWTGNGATEAPGPSIPVTVTIDSATAWHWALPRRTAPGVIHHRNFGLVTPAGATVDEPAASGTLIGPTVHWGPSAWAVVDQSLPVPSARDLSSGGPILSLANPQVRSATATTWTVRFAVDTPACWTLGNGSRDVCIDQMGTHVSGNHTNHPPTSITVVVSPLRNGIAIALPPQESSHSMPTGTLTIVQIEPDHDSAAADAGAVRGSST